MQNNKTTASLPSESSGMRASKLPALSNQPVHVVRACTDHQNNYLAYDGSLGKLAMYVPCKARTGFLRGSPHALPATWPQGTDKLTKIQIL